MALNRTTSLRLLKLGIGIVVAALIIAYALWRSLNYARGPLIQISEPSNGSSISASTVAIKGQALRVNNLTLNGNDVLVDEQGNFNETLIVFPGVNKLTLAAHDQFGRSTQTELNIVGLRGLQGQGTTSTTTAR